MRKTAFLTFVFFVFVVAACAASKPQFASEPVPLEMEKSLGAGVNETYSADYAAEEVEGEIAIIADSTAESRITRMVIKSADLSIVVAEPTQTMDEIAAMAETMGGLW